MRVDDKEWNHVKLLTNPEMVGSTRHMLFSNVYFRTHQVAGGLSNDFGLSEYFKDYINCKPIVFIIYFWSSLVLGLCLKTWQKNTCFGQRNLKLQIHIINRHTTILHIATNQISAIFRT